MLFIKPLLQLYGSFEFTRTPNSKSNRIEFGLREEQKKKLKFALSLLEEKKI